MMAMVHCHGCIVPRYWASVVKQGLVTSGMPISPCQACELGARLQTAATIFWATSLSLQDCVVVGDPGHLKQRQTNGCRARALRAGVQAAGLEGK
jgi:hypothetical protein